MSVFPNTDGKFSRSTDLPSNDAGWTMSCWTRITSTEAAYRILMGVEGASGIYDYLLLEPSSAVLEWEHNAGGAFSDDNVLTMTTNTWYFVAIRMVSGTQVEILYRAAGDSSLSTTGSLTIANSPPPTWTDLFFLGSSTAGEEWSNGEAFAFKFWQATLTAAEIWEESVRLLPRRRANLDSFLPLYSASGTDEGGLARDWTASGTLGTNGAQPSISRGGRNVRTFRPSTGAVSGSIAATLPGLTAALSMQQTHLASVAATLPGLTAAASLQQTHLASIAATLPGLTAAASLQQTHLASIAATLPGLVAAASLDSGEPAPSFGRRPKDRDRSRDRGVRRRC